MGFTEKDGAKIWTQHIEKFMNEENIWDHIMETDVVEVLVERVIHKKIMVAMLKTKSKKATRPSEVSMEMTVASGKIGINVMMDLCQHILDGRGMPDKWNISVIVPINKR